MPQIRRMWAILAVACVGISLPIGGVRADSVIDLQPNDPFNRTLAAAPATISWTNVTSNFTDHATGTLTITVDGPDVWAGMLADTTRYPVDLNAAFDFSTFTISTNVDVKLIGSNYIFTPIDPASALFHVEGITDPFSPGGPEALTFGNSNNLVTMGANVDPTVNPTVFAFVFTNQGSNYYTNPGENYLIAQIKKDAGSGNLNADYFITGVGSPGGAEDFKVDIYSLSLPLPAPFYTGLTGLLGIALSTTLIKKFRTA